MKRKKSLLLTLSFLLIFCPLFLSVKASADDELDQVERLSALCKVWGLLKYYHPEVAKGTIDWDAALIESIPGIKAAQDFDTFNLELERLITEAGGIDKSDYNPGVPAHPNEKLFKWIKDNDVFSKAVRHKLQTLQKKHSPADNFYVQATSVGAAGFNNEKHYKGTVDPYFPDENYRLLSLFRYWNIINYFFPYRDIMDQDWEEVLEEFIPRLIDVRNGTQYQLTIKELTVRIDDAHGISDGPFLSSYFGKYYPPFEVMEIEGQSVITHVYQQLLNPQDAVRNGDIIVKWNGTAMDTLKDTMKKYCQASNDASYSRSFVYQVLRSQTSDVNFTISRNDQIIDVTVAGYSKSIISAERKALDNQIEKWKLLPGNIGYIHLGVLDRSDVFPVMGELRETRAIIFDIRNYPRGTNYYLSAALYPDIAPFAMKQTPDFDYPGSFKWHPPFEGGYPNPNYYKGRVILLVNESTQSHAEFTAMTLQAAPDCTVIGSQTAGADGNMTRVVLPGYIITFFSGTGIYYPDGTPTQRVGIVPDIEVRPTIEGYRQGRDEVLEKAIQFVNEADEDEEDDD